MLEKMNFGSKEPYHDRIAKQENGE